VEKIPMNVLRKEKIQGQKVEQKGFTIIEVVLVLAIAGLIFLMVFIALPALQASQRDTARKSDVSTITAAVTQYVGNNRGSYPTTNTELTAISTNVSSNTTSEKINTTIGTNVNATDGVILFTPKSVCPTGGITGKGITLTTGTSRQYTLVTLLEAGGGSAYCQQG
jgi:prepilin-type N-terminal cleavage/methylation domain-containing protein